MATRYEVELGLVISPAELTRARRQIQQNVGQVPLRGAPGFAPVAGGRPAGGGGGFAAEAAGGAAARGFFSKAVPLLVGIAGSTAVIGAILNNQFSGLKQLIDIAGIIIQLYLKPISDLLFTFLKPVMIWSLKVLPLWFQFLSDPSQFLAPLAGMIAAAISARIEEITGIDLSALFASIGSFTSVVGDLTTQSGGIAQLFGAIIQTNIQNFIDTLSFEIQVLTGVVQLLTGDIRGLQTIFDAYAGWLEDNIRALTGLSNKADDLWLDFFQLGQKAGGVRDTLHGMKIDLTSVSGKFTTLGLHMGTSISSLSLFTEAIVGAGQGLVALGQSFVLFADFLATISGGGLTIPDIPFPSFGDVVLSPGGRAISTAPDDFLIATKDPAGLAASVSGGGGGGATFNNTFIINARPEDEVRRISEQLRDQLRRVQA